MREDLARHGRRGLAAAARRARPARRARSRGWSAGREADEPAVRQQLVRCRRPLEPGVRRRPAPSRSCRRPRSPGAARASRCPPPPRARMPSSTDRDRLRTHQIGGAPAAARRLAREVRAHQPAAVGDRTPATRAICSGVALTWPCPIATETVSPAYQGVFSTRSFHSALGMSPLASCGQIDAGRRAEPHELGPLREAVRSRAGSRPGRSRRCTRRAIARRRSDDPVPRAVQRNTVL